MEHVFGRENLEEFAVSPGNFLQKILMKLPFKFILKS